MKTKTKETALSSFRQYNKSPQQNLSKEQVAALASLSKNKDIVIQKSDKVVIVDKETSIKRMENLLTDERKFERVTLKNDTSCKVHKQEVEGCPLFTPILSALQTPTYNLAKFLVPILDPLTKNEYTV